MKIRKIHLGILFATLIISLLASIIYVKNMPKPGRKDMVFLTIGLDQSKLVNEGSSYEILRATEHFSDIVLGWTLDPAFKHNLLRDANLELSGEKQEKSNIIFYLTSEVDIFDEDRQLFIKMLQNKIDSYNSKSKSGYLIANYSFFDLEIPNNDLRIIAGIVLLSLLTVSSLLFFGSVVHHKDR